MGVIFTQEHKPRSGRAAQLWRWFTDQEIAYTTPGGTKLLRKPANVAPQSLQMIRAGRVQKSAGAAEAEIVCDGATFFVHDLSSTIAAAPQPVEYPHSARTFYL
jgi:hypothetical protein